VFEIPNFRQTNSTQPMRIFWLHHWTKMSLLKAARSSTVRFCGRFHTTCIYWAGSSTCTWSVFQLLATKWEWNLSL